MLSVSIVQINADLGCPCCIHPSSIAGTSKERSANALEQMGPAILNGGITTFLALFFLAFSQSYAFIVFFKVSDYDDYSD